MIKKLKIEKSVARLGTQISDRCWQCAFAAPLHPLRPHKTHVYLRGKVQPQ